MSKIVDVTRGTQNIAGVVVLLNDGRTLIVDVLPHYTTRDFLLALNEGRVAEALGEDLLSGKTFATGITVATHGASFMFSEDDVMIFATAVAALFCFHAFKGDEITIPLTAIVAGESRRMQDIVLNSMIIALVGIANQNTPLSITAFLR